mgnify:CR=1 FL=1
MTPRDLAAALALVPAKRLKLVQLAWDLAGKRGINMAKAMRRADEIDVAQKEAAAYIKSVEELRWALTRMGDPSR